MMETMYKLIACDLDETLLTTNDPHVSDVNADAVKKLRPLGVKFVPATGRNFLTVKETLEELGLYGLENEYVISLNGAVISENRNDRILHFQGIDYGLVKEIYERSKNYDVGLHVYTDRETYVKDLPDYEKEILKDRDLHFIEFKEIEELRDKKLTKILYVNRDYDYLKRVEQDFSDIMEQVDISYSSNRYFEFNAKGVNKGNALIRLCEILKIDRSEVIAIGDNFNDKTMIEVAGLGIGVANTIEGMKRYCDVITENDCAHGAVAEVIEKYILK